MEKLTPLLIIIILLPVELLGCILTIIYQTIRNMNSPLDFEGAKVGYHHGVQLDMEFYVFVKHYFTAVFKRK